MNSKVNTFFTAVSDAEFDIIALSETWLHDGVSGSELFPSSYHVLRSDRDFGAHGVSKGGGVMLAIKTGYDFTVLNLDDLRTTYPRIDVVGCKLKLNNCPMHLFCIYVPPTVTFHDFECFLDMFQTHLIAVDNILIVGDFNAPRLTGGMSDGKSTALRLFCEFSGSQQYNCVVNAASRLLDLVISTFRCRVEEADRPFVPLDLHHPALSVSFIQPGSCDFLPLRYNQTHSKYNFRKADFPGLYHALSETDWSSLESFGDVDEACIEFYGTLCAVLDQFVPKCRFVSGSYPVWFTAGIIRDLKKKSNLWRTYRRTSSTDDLTRYKILRAKIKRDISQAFTNFQESANNCLGCDPKSLWNFIREKTRSSSIPSEVHFDSRTFSGPAVVEGFREFFSSVHVRSSSDMTVLENNYPTNILRIDTIENDLIMKSLSRLPNSFTAGDDQIPNFILKDCRTVFVRPLHHIFNLAITSCKFPAVWKRSKIVPIFKGGDRSHIGDYRPISILVGFSKIFEMCLYDLIYPFVCPILSPVQHGFVRGRSTVTNLCVVSGTLSRALDSRGQVDVVYTDLSKAFDRVNHDLLLRKMDQSGFSNSLLLLLRSYLTNRRQYVMIDGHKSRVFSPSSGVPQGSNLGPLFFLLFINDAPLLFDSDCLLYADDLKLYRRVTCLDDCLSLQSDLERLSDWCSLNLLSLNISKCRVVSYTRLHSPILYPYKLLGEDIIRSNCVRDLGVTFSCDLSFREHVEEICGTACRISGFIVRNCSSFTNIRTLRALYCALVRSRLEYGAIVWNPLLKCEIQALESVQRRFLKFIAYVATGEYPPNGFDHSLLLESCDVQSLEHRRTVFTLRFLYQLVHGRFDSPELVSCLSWRVPSFNSRSCLAFIPPKARTNVLAQSPMHRMMTIFNQIAHLCDINSDSLGSIIATAERALGS